MKKCPYCAEEIQDEAIVCRYCGRELTSPVTPQQIAIPSQLAQSKAKPPAKKPNSLVRFIGIGVAFVVTFCCVIGAGLVLSSKQTANPTIAPTKSVNPGATIAIKVPTSTAGPTPTAAPTIAPTKELGKTRDNPLPRNSVVDIGGDMQVMITNVQRPANDIVAQGNMFNATPIPNVQEYMIVKLHVECKKSSNEKCNFNDYEFKTVGADGKVHDRASVAGVPQAFEPFAEFFGDAALDGNIAFLVNQGDASVVLFHEPLFFGDPVYIALEPTSAQAPTETSLSTEAPAYTNTPTPQYKLIAKQVIDNMVVIDPKYNNDRQALLYISKEICDGEDICVVLFWDDESKAATSLPMTDQQVNNQVAQYNINKNTGLDRLLLCNQGSCN